MSLFIAVLKCIFCVEDYEEREIRHSYHAVDRGYQYNTVSTSNAYFGQTIDGFKAQSGSYPSQTKSTNVLNRETTGKSSAPVQLSRYVDVKSGAKDDVYGAYPPKQPSIPNLGNISGNSASIKLSGAGTVNSISSSTISGNNKDANVVFQLSSVRSHSLNQPSFTSKPSLPSVSEKPSEMSQKVKNLTSSSPRGNSNHGEDANKGTSCGTDGRYSSNVSLAASKQFQSSTRFPFSSEFLNSSSLSNDAGKFPPAEKTDKTSYSYCSSTEKSQSQKPPPLSTKPTICLEPSSSSSPCSKTTYFWVVKEASSTYVFNKEFKSLIEKDIVPGVLKMPPSMSSYKDYFHALLYAEDCYLEKWDGFVMEDVKVELEQAAIYTRRGKSRSLSAEDDKDEKVFVTFELDKIRERRPFLISRDFVSLQPLNRTIKPFQGVIYRVVKSNLVLAEFGQDFYSHHHPINKYEVKFSFNRVCLKRAHQAVAAASASLFRNIIFPTVTPKHELPSTELFARYVYKKEAFTVDQILRLQGAPPYLVEGPLGVEKYCLTKTGMLIVQAIHGIVRADPLKKILVCAPVNRTCDLLMRGLKVGMSESDMFRANAAFRELDGVPMDILPSCLYKEDAKCFTCPSLKELKRYKVILTTFMSSYRLYGEGIMAGHFSHIFLVDASSATEPEAMVPLANFVTDATIVVVTGSPRNHSGWVRSKIARENGLTTSYFERLSGSGRYKEQDPKYIVSLLR